MRAKLGAALFVVVFACAGGAKADARADWVVARISAGAAPAKGTLQLYGPLDYDGRTPPEALVALGSNIQAFNDGRDDRHVMTTADAGGVDVAIGGGATNHVYLEFNITFDLAPGQTIGALFAMGGIDLTYVHGRMYPTEGSPSFTLREGSGTTAVFLADPLNTGPAAAFGSAAVGSATAVRHVDDGIVGGMIWRCEQCAGSWHSSDGRGAAWSATGGAGRGYALTGGPIGFAGAPATWTWSWNGIATAQDSYVPLLFDGTPAIAAYAPVGDDWSLFAG